MTEISNMSNGDACGVSTRPRYLTVAQVAASYGLKVSRVRYLVYTRQVPFMKLGQSVLFDPAELEKWFASKVVLTSADLEAEQAKKRQP